MGANWGCLRLGAKHVFELRDAPGISSLDHASQDTMKTPRLYRATALAISKGKEDNSS
jgi:hypothetical protein